MKKAALFLLTTLMFGCAGSGPLTTDAKTANDVKTAPTKPAATAEMPADLQKHAIEQSKQRWALVLNGKFPETYDFLTPSSQRGITREDYGRRIASLRIRAADVISSQCDAGSCVVRVTLGIGQMVPRVGEVPHQLPFEERWMWSEGKLGLIRR